MKTLILPLLAFALFGLMFALGSDPLSVSCGTLTDTHKTAPTAGDPYTAQIFASGGTPPYVYQASNLPAGLQFDPSTGIVNGAVLQNGTFVIPIGVTDSLKDAAFNSCTLWIAPNPGAHRKK